MKKQKIKFPIKLIFIILIVLIGIFTLRAVSRNLKNAPFFKITDIIMKENNSLDLSYLKGRNIFSVDLNKEAKRLALNLINYKKIRIIRVLPDRLFVDFVKRKAFAYVKLYRYFCVDDDGLLFDEPLEAFDPNLAVILGLDTKIFGPKTGTLYNNSELLLALNILKEFKKNKALGGYQIKTIDVTTPVNAAIFLSLNQAPGSIDRPTLEVKIGQNNFVDKINILSSLLAQTNNERNNIKYIDLRFKEPVIKLKGILD